MFRAVLEQCNKIMPTWCSTYLCLKLRVLAPPPWHQCPITEDNAESFLQKTHKCKPRSLYRCVVYVHMSNRTIFIGSVLSVYYTSIRHNYMFRPLMLAIFRLYMNTYQTVIQTYVGCFLRGREGVVDTTPSLTPKK